MLGDAQYHARSVMIANVLEVWNASARQHVLPGTAFTVEQVGRRLLKLVASLAAVVRPMNVTRVNFVLRTLDVNQTFSFAESPMKVPLNLAQVLKAPRRARTKAPDNVQRINIASHSSLRVHQVLTP